MAKTDMEGNKVLFARSLNTMTRFYDGAVEVKQGADGILPWSQIE
jgi:hypothetical protein